MLMKYYWFIFLSFLIFSKCTKTCGSDCLNCDTSNGNCSQCQKGFYLNSLSCVDKCPEELYADNYSMGCKTIIESPIYIKAFTFSRCINSCGLEFSDCSCKSDCKNSGTCCSDFQYCEIIYENNIKVKEENSNCKFSSRDKKICFQCKENFYFYNNECLEKCPEGTNSLNQNKICVKSESKFFKY